MSRCISLTARTGLRGKRRVEAVERGELFFVGRGVLDEAPHALDHGGTHLELTEVAALIEGVAEEMSSHMMKEEDILFPAAAQLIDDTRLERLDRQMRATVTAGTHATSPGPIATRRRRSASASDPYDPISRPPTSSIV